MDELVQQVAQTDWQRMGPRQRSAWVAQSKRVGQLRDGDELISIFLADGTEHRVSKRTDTGKNIITPEVQAAYKLVDADGSGALDKEELSDALHALGVDRNSKECRRLLRKFDVDGDKLYSLYEFAQLMRDLRAAELESAEDRDSLLRRTKRLLRCAGSELSLTEPGCDGVQLRVRRDGRSMLIAVHKGTMPFPMASLVPFSPGLSKYVRALTDAYKLDLRYWECCTPLVIELGTLACAGC